MDDWSRQLGELLETAARDVEQSLEQAIADTMQVADQVADDLEQQFGPVLDQWTERLQHTVEPLERVLDAEVERMANEVSTVLTPVVTPLVEGLETWFEAIAAPLNNTVEPLLNNHPTCVGCRHYFGQTYGGHTLVCAMHPYGAETSHCPDWETVWPQPPNKG